MRYEHLDFSMSNRKLTKPVDYISPFPEKNRTSRKTKTLHQVHTYTRTQKNNIQSHLFPWYVNSPVLNITPLDHGKSVVRGRRCDDVVLSICVWMLEEKGDIKTTRKHGKWHTDISPLLFPCVTDTSSFFGIDG